MTVVAAALMPVASVTQQHKYFFTVVILKIMSEMCELSLEKLLSYCRSLLQKKSTPSFPALKHCALPNGDNIGDSHSNSSVPEEPPQGSFPQALQGGRQAAAADLAEKQG